MTRVGTRHRRKPGQAGTYIGSSVGWIRDLHQVSPRDYQTLAGQLGKSSGLTFSVYVLSLYLHAENIDIILSITEVKG